MSTQTFTPYTFDSEAGLNGPILASFPQKIPQNIGSISFSAFENSKNSQNKKRVIKGRGKNINYVASSTQLNVADRNQAQDYYIGVISSKGLVYTMPVACPY